MIVSINQPAYLPWLGYFDRIIKSDLHIVLDHVQFEKNSVVNRNKIRTNDGWRWLTVPVITKHRFGQLDINKLEIDNSGPWRKKHLGSIQSNYSGAKFYSEYIPFYKNLYLQKEIKLAPLLEKSTKFFLNTLDIKTELIKSSSLSPQFKKSNLILELCQKVGASGYLSGPFGRDYLDKDLFNSAGIELIFHQYDHPEYIQIFDGFQPFMSIIDLLFNYGPDSTGILKK